MREPQQDQIPNPLSAEQFESLAAPIALYPDSLLTPSVGRLDCTRLHIVIAEPWAEAYKKSGAAPIIYHHSNFRILTA